MTGEQRPAAERPADVAFQAHIDLLRLFLTQRNDIVERVQGLLNAQRKPLQYLRDGPLLARHLDDCFFTNVTHDQSRLRNELEEAHRANGFKPRQTPGVHNDLIDPAEMMARAFHLWQQTRWPGRQGRVRYAHTLFNLYVLRRLILLAMRLWDAGLAPAGERLGRIQNVLDELWHGTEADQPTLVRDARWLIPLAQSPTTDELWGYFRVAEHAAESFSAEDRLAVHEATVRMAGGHLRSQLRHLCVQKGVSLDDHELLLTTRNSNALDLALLIQGLVPLLEAYEQAARRGDDRRRLELAAGICQGISPDPDLFVNRLDLLGPYSMIEHLFIACDRDGDVIYTSTGQRHLKLLEEYRARIGRLATSLATDCSHFRPVPGTYSPYGVLYGFSSRLLEHMALKTLAPEAVTRFSVEDAFTDGDADKLAWVSGWRKLPHIPEDVAKLFEYPQAFAEEVFARIEQALQRGVVDGGGKAGARAGRLSILSEDQEAASTESSTPDLPARYCRSSDDQIVAAGRAEPLDQTQLLHSRLEGEFAVSYETPGGWMAISKDVLTDVLGAGQDAKISGLPDTAAGVLRLMCLDLAVPPESTRSRPAR